MFVKVLAVQIVVVVAGGGNDVHQPVGDAYELVALFLHVFGVGIAVVPAVHDDVLRFHGGVTLGVCQCAPNDGLLAEFLYVFDVAVGEVTEFLNNVFLGV